MDRVRIALLMYAAGAIAGLVLTDARPAARIALAALWPVGPLAFVVTIVGLFAAALVIFPLFGAGVVLAAAAWWAFG